MSSTTAPDSLLRPTDIYETSSEIPRLYKLRASDPSFIDIPLAELCQQCRGPPTATYAPAQPRAPDQSPEPFPFFPSFELGTKPVLSAAQCALEEQALADQTAIKTRITNILLADARAWSDAWIPLDAAHRLDGLVSRWPGAPLTTGWAELTGNEDDFWLWRSQMFQRRTLALAKWRRDLTWAAPIPYPTLPSDHNRASLSQDHTTTTRGRRLAYSPTRHTPRTSTQYNRQYPRQRSLSGQRGESFLPQDASNHHVPTQLVAYAFRWECDADTPESFWSQLAADADNWVADLLGDRLEKRVFYPPLKTCDASPGCVDRALIDSDHHGAAFLLEDDPNGESISMLQSENSRPDAPFAFFPLFDIFRWESTAESEAHEAYIRMKAARYCDEGEDVFNNWLEGSMETMDGPSVSMTFLTSGSPFTSESDDSERLQSSPSDISYIGELQRTLPNERSHATRRSWTCSTDGSRMEHEIAEELDAGEDFIVRLLRCVGLDD